MIKKLETCDLCLGTYHQNNPTGYGRVIRDGKKIIKIVEEKDATEKQRRLPK